jgi:hypothetical protein
MASGLPVVCSNLFEVSLMNTPAFLAKNNIEFASMILQSLKINLEMKKEIIKFAKQNTWGNRFTQLKTILNIN